MASTRSGYYTALDGFRAVAFLLVFFFHYEGLPWGWVGVDLFFVLSGFLITGILYDGRDKANRYYNFYLRRTMRIFPLFYAVLLALVVLTPLFKWNWNKLWLAWPLYVGNFLRLAVDIDPGRYNFLRAQASLPGVLHHLTVSVEHFWSLCVEEQFYLIWPWVVFTVRDRRKLMWICGLSLPVVLAMRFGVTYLMPEIYSVQKIVYYVTPLRVDALLLGGLVALWLRGPQPEKLFELAPRVAAAVAGLGLAGVLFALVRYHRVTTPRWGDTWGVTVLDIFGAALVLLCLKDDNIVYRCMNIPWLRWLGRISYGLYVYHGLFQGISQQIARQLVSHFVGPVTAIIGLTMTIVVSWLSFTYFESAFLKLKERFTRRSPVMEKTVSSYATN